MHSTLLYASIRKPTCNNIEIERILESARKNNPAMDITGVLLYNRIKFLQYLEGDYDVITELYHKIKEDERHMNVIMISRDRNVISERLFPSWAMGEKNLDDGSFNLQAIDQSTQDLFEKALNGQELESGKTFDLIRTILR